MTLPAIRFARRAAGEVVEDIATGLEWDLDPPGSPADWMTAMAASDPAGWRLPSLEEVTSLLTALPGDWCPGDGAVASVMLWTASESPFASVDDARAVAWSGVGQFAVVVRGKASQAVCWRVRRVLPAD